MPAAFSLPQEQIDSILRSGGGRDNSRKRIYAKYQQGKTPEEMAEFLKNEYKTTGKGFEFDGNPVSLWFDEMGMRIGYGTSAKENTLAVMSWSEVESHIRVMVENGTYMSANEVFLVDAVERERIATDINNFFRDGISEMPESLELKFSNYPASMERLCELLSTTEGRELIQNGASDRTDEGERGDNGADESRESDALGSEDEQHRTLGRGDRDDGTDLQLNIEQPEGTYQQLSLFPSFEEQVGTIAAAEASIQYTMLCDTLRHQKTCNRL